MGLHVPLLGRTHLQGNKPFPTCVGMNRNQKQNLLDNPTVPYVRGDEPLPIADVPEPKPRSLRAWG